MMDTSNTSFPESSVSRNQQLTGTSNNPPFSANPTAQR